MAFPCRFNLPAFARRRSGALARWAMVGHLRPHAGAFRRRLRARKPYRHGGDLSRPLSRSPGPSPGRLLPRLSATTCCIFALRARTIPASCCSPPDRSTRPTSSTPTWLAISASRWSQGGDLTVRENRVFLKSLEGLQAGGRDPAPRGRRFLRPHRTALRLLPGRGRPGRGRARGQRGGRQCVGQRADRNARPSCPSSPA